MNKWTELNIKKSTFYKYKKEGMSDDIQDAKDWIANRHGLITSGTNQIIVGGKRFDAMDLIDLRGQVMEGQVEHLKLKNKIKEFELRMKSGELVQTSKLAETLSKILIPLRKSLDKLPTRIANKLCPDDADASAWIDAELQKIYSDLQRTMDGNTL